MPTSDPALIYGATGYTGRLLARAAVARGLRPIVCGRDERKVAAFAGALGLEHRVARLDSGWGSVLRDIAVVINAAGPFSATSGPVAGACLRAGVHYLDISGEVDAIEHVARRDGDARDRRVMLMPAVGFDVVPSDCLALHLTRRLPGAHRLTLGISGLELMSRGSARTLAGEYGRPTRVRRGGAVVGVPPGSLWRDIDYGRGPRPSVAVSWGDVASSYYTTGVPDIEVYFEATAAVSTMATLNRSFGALLASPAAQRWLRLQVEMLPEGPTDAERGARCAVIAAEVEDGAGRRARARLRTPEVYTLTGTIGAAVLERVLRGDLETGFQTPARVYGPDFVLRFTGVSREDVALR
jgi:short subunit dehydrogenase-like uncharacterized protein